jgi:thioesterase domain-containing protein/acyl carrier protein
LLAIWDEVLGQTAIGVTDNFFELGGHSLLAVRLLAQIEAAFDRRLSVATLYQAPTVAKLAQMLQSQPSQALSPAVAQIQPGRPSATQPILFCIHVLGRGLSYYRPLAKYLGADQPMYGLSAQIDSSIQAPRDRVDALAAYYIEQMRQLQPQGPYFLTGVSFGGLVAFEMAQQLVAQGEEVGMLALLDTYGPDAVKKLPTDRVVSSHLNRLSTESVAHAWDVLQAKIVGLKNQCVKHYKLLACKVYMRMGWTLPYDLQSFFFRQQNKKAMRGYTPTSYPGKITLMKAMEFEWGGVGSYQDPTLGWGPLAIGGLEVYDVPGDHLGMLQDPHAPVLAGYLQDCIQRSVVPARPMQLSQR